MTAVENVACQRTSFYYDNRIDVFMVDIFNFEINERSEFGHFSNLECTRMS
jgi:hypothetical protein